jgi:hypothetical protein
MTLSRAARLRRELVPTVRAVSRDDAGAAGRSGPDQNWAGVTPASWAAFYPGRVGAAELGPDHAQRAASRATEDGVHVIVPARGESPSGRREATPPIWSAARS